MQLPSIENLQCFVAAARFLHFRSAARSVALTPAAFGQRIKQLEEQVGERLFVRTTRSIALSEAGLAMKPYAERTLADALECLRAARGEVGPPPMELVLGTRQELGLSWIVPQLEPLAKAFPTVGIHLYFGSGPDLLLRVRTMEIDCAVTSSRFTDPKLDAYRLHREDYVFVAAASLLRDRPFRRGEDAPAHTLLDASADLPLFRYWRDAPGGGDRLRFGRVVYLGSIEAILHRVLDRAGVAVLPLYLVERHLARGTLKRILPSIEPAHDFFRLVFRADDPRRSVYEALAAEMRRSPLR